VVLINSNRRKMRGRRCNCSREGGLITPERCYGAAMAVARPTAVSMSVGRRRSTRTSSLSLTLPGQPCLRSLSKHAAHYVLRSTSCHLYPDNSQPEKGVSRTSCRRIASVATTARTYAHSSVTGTKMTAKYPDR
jgi:hypothetical protein